MNEVDLTKRPPPVVITGPNGTRTNEDEREYQKKYRQSLPKDYRKKHRNSRKNVVEIMRIEGTHTITFD